MSSETTNKRVHLVSILGLGNSRDADKAYVPVAYRIPDQDPRRESGVTQLVQSAICELFDVSSVHFIGTQEVEERWYAGDTPRVLKHYRGPGTLPPFTLIPKGDGERELHQIFECVVNALQSAADGEDPPSTILFDVTHGFRVQPMIGLAAASYVQSEWVREVRRSRPELRVVYGAFDPALQENQIASIWDITAFLDYSRWNEAFNALTRFGKADDLHAMVTLIESRERNKLSDPHDREQHKHINWLKELRSNAIAFTEDLATTRSEHIEASAKKLSRTLENERAEHWIDTYQLLENAVKELRTQSHALDVNIYSKDGMQAVALMAKQLVRSEQYTQAMILMSEALAVYCGLLVTPQGSGKEDILQQGQATLNARTRSMVIRKNPEDALDHAGKLRGDIEVSRNSLAHGGFSTTNAGSQSAQSLITKVKDTQGRFQELVEMMPEPGSLSAQTSQETTGVFLNLSNHPISEWPEAQRLSAERFGRPEELEDWDGTISPTTEISQIVGRAMRHVNTIKNMNVTSAFVAGEPSFCTALVALLQAENITCYTTTTERKKIEIPKADGSVFIHSVYEFAGWREYPDLQKLLEP